MGSSNYQEKLNLILEDLASIEHERWSHWQSHMHSKALRQPDGSLLIPADLVARWEKQIAARYEELSDVEKESDREQVRKYLSFIARALSEYE
jgi:hypothetical protein